MRVLIHDYPGHPFQAQLSRELARRDHEVLHLYCPSVMSGRGRLSRADTDPPGLQFGQVDLGRQFEKYRPLRRSADEFRYGSLLSRRLAAYEPDVIVSSNTPLLEQWLLWRTASRLGIRKVLWEQDILGIGIINALRQKLPIGGGLIGTAFLNLEMRLLRASNAVVVISEDFAPILQDGGVDTESIHVIENWAPIDEHYETLRRDMFTLMQDLRIAA